VSGPWGRAPSYWVATPEGHGARESVQRSVRMKASKGQGPRAGPGWNKPGRLGREQGIERVRNPGDATELDGLGSVGMYSGSARLGRR